ncbi:MAG TPA: hypothetical protein VEA16_11445 [Vicinamibacterales bacterium]|nr:hypothetical protein [Vicinamibacterales bacterium]
MVVRKGEAMVRPPSATASNGAPDGLTVVNKTNGRIWVMLPDGIFDQNNNGVPEAVSVNVVAAGATANFRTIANPPDGFYSFPIFCEQTFSFAQGNSDPEFIVEN